MTSLDAASDSDVAAAEVAVGSIAAVREADTATRRGRHARTRADADQLAARRLRRGALLPSMAATAVAAAVTALIVFGTSGLQAPVSTPDDGAGPAGARTGPRSSALAPPLLGWPGSTAGGSDPTSPLGAGSPGGRSLGAGSYGGGSLGAGSYGAGSYGTAPAGAGSSGTGSLAAGSTSAGLPTGTGWSSTVDWRSVLGAGAGSGGQAARSSRIVWPTSLADWIAVGGDIARALGTESRTGSGNAARNDVQPAQLRTAAGASTGSGSADSATTRPTGSGGSSTGAGSSSGGSGAAAPVATVPAGASPLQILAARALAAHALAGQTMAGQSRSGQSRSGQTTAGQSTAGRAVSTTDPTCGGWSGIALPALWSSAFSALPGLIGDAALNLGIDPALGLDLSDLTPDVDTPDVNVNVNVDVDVAGPPNVHSVRLPDTTG